MDTTMSNISDKPKSLYLDVPRWGEYPEIDDFIISIGKRKSNSVYHISKIKSTTERKNRMIRFYLEVYKTDLITALNRDKKNQRIITMSWYPWKKS